MIALVFLALLTAGCGQSALSSSGGSAGAIRVTAAENFWGSVATQLGGKKVAVTSIIVNPDTDPHSYEPTAADGRALASSQMAIVNGIGYDTWASKLLAANPSSGRVVLDVGSLLGLTQGDNPHQWYSPASLERVIAAITADYRRLDPRDAGYFEGRRREFETSGLAEYDRLRAADPLPLRGRPGRLLGEHLPAPGRKPGAEADYPLQLRQGGR